LKIPSPFLAVVADILSTRYSHAQLDLLFVEKGAPGDPPAGSKPVKCQIWLNLVNKECADPFSVVGGIIENIMEEVPGSPFYGGSSAGTIKLRNDRIEAALSRHGLRYAQGGHIYPVSGLAPSRTLDTILRTRDLTALTAEFERAQASLATDPAAAMLAACAILEAFCKVYIEDTPDLEMPGTPTMKPLWATVQKHLGLDPAAVVDDDLKRILGGLSSVVDGLGAARTHASSAHGRGRKAYKVEPRHARLAVNSAHTLTVFLLETWDARKGKA
jgi:hypothetical protein